MLTEALGLGRHGDFERLRQFLLGEVADRHDGALEQDGEHGARLHAAWTSEDAGEVLAKEGATPKQSAGILGHDDLDHVELYSKDGAGAARRGWNGEASEAVCLTHCLTRLSTLDAKPCA